MSLINEALKRAQRAQQQQPPVPGTDRLPQPAESGSSPPRLFWLLPVILGMVCLLAGWFLWTGWTTLKQTRQSALTSPPISEMAQPLDRSSGIGSDRPVANETEVDQGQEWAAARDVQPMALNTVQESGAESATAITIAGEQAYAGSSQTDNTDGAPGMDSIADVPPEAAFKVQGIFYRLSKPSAVINGRTLYVGDEIDGAKIVAIERHAVRLFIGKETVRVSMR
jgi:hypothetical protein